MKHTLITSLTQLASRRRLLILMIVFLLISIGAIIYMSVTIHPSYSRIYSHYTAYGTVHLYRDSWMYLLSFIAFVIINFSFAFGICLKMLRHGREQLALLMGWAGITLVLMVILVYYRLIGLV